MLLLALLLQTATLRVVPDTALIERDPTTRVGYANFDFVIASRAAAPVELASIVMTAHDADGRMLLRRFCDGSGLGPCIRTVPDRVVRPGGSTIVYNPFDELPAGVALGQLRYVLVLADTAGTVTDSLVTTVPLRDYAARADLVLPLRGRVLVFDGHDFYAHHRRWNLAHPVVGPLLRRNSGRYAYDFSIVDSAGRMYREDGARN
jgi:hypothetical protein